MGNFVFRRKRRQPTEELDEIVLIIKDLENQLSQCLKGRAEFLRLLYYFMLFLFTVTSAYVWLHFHNIKVRIAVICATFFAILIISFILRYLLFTFYNWLITKKRKKMSFYMERKIAIIEDVKENEKFKVAKDIIEKYGSKEDALNIADSPDNRKGKRFYIISSVYHLENLGKPNLKPLAVTKNQKNANKSLSLNPNALPNIVSCPTTPLTTTIPGGPLEMAKVMPKLHEIRDSKFLRTPIRPFVEQSQTPIDKIIDYVIGENISNRYNVFVVLNNNRYALICMQCRTHNGMALKEEFDQISYLCFKCKYVSSFNNYHL